MSIALIQVEASHLLPLQTKQMPRMKRKRRSSKSSLQLSNTNYKTENFQELQGSNEYLKRNQILRNNFPSKEHLLLSSEYRNCTDKIHTRLPDVTKFSSEQMELALMLESHGYVLRAEIGEDFIFIRPDLFSTVIY